MARGLLIKRMMKATRSTSTADCRHALNALKHAVIEGNHHQYLPLLDRARAAGATDEDIDHTVHAALVALLESAEQPVTARELAALWPA